MPNQVFRTSYLCAGFTGNDRAPVIIETPAFILYAHLKHYKTAKKQILVIHTITRHYFVQQ